MNAVIGIDLSEGSCAGAAAVKAMLARGEEFNLPWTLACDTTCLRCMPWWWRPAITHYLTFDECKWQAYMTSWEKRR